MSETFGAFGPYLRVHGSSDDGQRWRGSVLICIPANLGARPAVLLSDAGKQPRIEGTLIDTLADTAFFRTDLNLRLSQQERTVQYFCDLGPEASSGQVWHSFRLPALGASWRWAFHAGASVSSGQKVEGSAARAAPIWKALLLRHAQAPLHALVGGGGQINGDAVFKREPFAMWLDLATRELREEAEFTEAMAAAAAASYLRTYTHSWAQEGVRQVMSDIPQMMTWDHPDIFTLYGSFHSTQQNCAVFRGLFEVAKRFYLLFQHHTTDIRAGLDRDFVSSTSLSFVRELGPGMAVAAMDGRSERSRERVATPPTWAAVGESISRLPRGVKHCVVVLPTPPHWPKVPLGDYAAQGTSKVAQWDSKGTITGLMAKVNFGPASPHLQQPSQDALLDDWYASAHWQERRLMMEQMQSLAASRQLRISFVSGGTGAAAVALFYSFPKAVPAQYDFRWMASVVAPPLVDVPLSDAAARALQLVSVASQGVNPATKEKVVRLFKDTQPTLAKILPRRGWVEVNMLPSGKVAAAGVPQRHATASSHQGGDLGERAFLLVGKTTQFLKKTVQQARGDTSYIDDKDKVVVLPHTSEALVFELHLEPVGQTDHMLTYEYVVPTFDGAHSGDGTAAMPPTFGGNGSGARVEAGVAGYEAHETVAPGRQEGAAHYQEAAIGQSAALSGMGYSSHTHTSSQPESFTGTGSDGGIPFRYAEVSVPPDPTQQHQGPPPASGAAAYGLASPPQQQQQRKSGLAAKLQGNSSGEIRRQEDYMSGPPPSIHPTGPPSQALGTDPFGPGGSNRGGLNNEQPALDQQDGYWHPPSSGSSVPNRPQPGGDSGDGGGVGQYSRTGMLHVLPQELTPPSGGSAPYQAIPVMRQPQLAQHAPPQTFGTYSQVYGSGGGTSPPGAPQSETAGKPPLTADYPPVIVRNPPMTTGNPSVTAGFPPISSQGREEQAALNPKPVTPPSSATPQGKTSDAATMAFLAGLK